MNQQWKIGLAIIALALGLMQSAYAATDNTTKPTTTTAAATAMVNINTATVDQLTTIKGLGPKKAQAIVDYRKQNGAFKSVDDLKKVSGISEKLFASIKPQITV